jgi:hypothetical protein
MSVISQTNTLAYSVEMGLLWKTHSGVTTPIATSFVLLPTLPRGMGRQQGVSPVISSTRYHVRMAAVEPMLLRRGGGDGF